MASVGGAAIKGTVIRVIQEDICGNPITGASGAMVVANSFTRVEMAPQYEDGTEFFERTADGLLCVNQKDPPILKRMQLTVDLCSVDPDMTPMVLSARELVSTAPVSGYGFAVMEGASTSHFSLEVWQRVAGQGACNPQGLPQFIYHAWPHVTNVKVNTYTIENAKSVLSFIGETVAASSQWGDGPGSGTSWLQAGAGGISGTSDHWLWNITTVTPPVAVLGKQQLT
jgi:hypothetical protein